MTDTARESWAHLQPTEGLDGLHLRYIVDDERVQITGVYLHGDDLATSHIRGIPLSRYAEQLQQYFQRIRGMSSQHGIPIDEPEPTSPNPRISDLEAQQVSPLPKLPKLPSLSRSRGESSERFYSRVATAYKIASARTKAPAALLAAHADVNVRTVHFWIREARRLGLLPAGRQGRAG